jgi:NADPH:quinone reductase-like Zn-dependent oxidoreductase
MLRDIPPTPQRERGAGVRYAICTVTPAQAVISTLDKAYPARNPVAEQTQPLTIWRTRMQAIQFKSYGGADKLSLAECERPQPAAHQLLVEVHSISINPIDWKLYGGALRLVKPMRFPSIPCFDFAGEVMETGSGVEDYKQGERVFGMLPMNGMGAAAEYIAVDIDYVSRIPDTLSFNAAAGMPLAGMTALQALRDKGNLQAGQRLLVIGAGGGVGHYAIQIGKALKAHVTGVCSTRNIERVRELGADEVLDYATPDFAPPQHAFDVILDAVAHKSFGYWQPALKPQGAYISVLPSLGLALHAMKQSFLMSPQRIRLIMVKPLRKDLDYLAGLAREGRLQTHIDHLYPLSEFGAALEKSKQGHAQGKIIVAVKAE